MIAVDCTISEIRFGDVVGRCVLGRSTVAAATKREGDGATPMGIWPVRAVLMKPDTGFDPPLLPWRWLRRSDGWSDSASDADYNRPVRLPHPLSAEALHRADNAYDVIIVLGHNDAPVVPWSGSAIFLHLINGAATEGCVAIDPDTMRALLRFLTKDESVSIGSGRYEDHV